MGKINEILIDGYFYLRGDKRLKYLAELKKSLFYDYYRMKDLQFAQIKSVLEYSYRSIPFYKYWFDLNQVKIENIKDYTDYAKMVPVLEKSDILHKIHLLKNINSDKYVNQSTGGSTGQTLKFRMSTIDHQMGTALLLRGMGYGGYKLGDKILVLAGGSLVKATKKNKPDILNKVFNQYKISSYGLTEEDLENIVTLISKNNIRFLRGYASALYLLAEFCHSGGHRLTIEAIFSTSERLLDNQRTVIETVFGAKVYDQYGLNDGGVSAFQYNDENGLLIDMERSYLEIDNEDFLLSKNCEGKILATSFTNKEFPFIRYDTGDIGEVSFDHVENTPGRPRLKKILGRETEFLFINNRKIASPVLTVLMGKTNAEQYRIIQKGENYIEIQIKKGKDYGKSDDEFIQRSLFDNCGSFELKINYVEMFENENKHKFIVREWNKL